MKERILSSDDKGDVCFREKEVIKRFCPKGERIPRDCGSKTDSDSGDKQSGTEGLLGRFGDRLAKWKGTETAPTPEAAGMFTPGIGQKCGD